MNPTVDVLEKELQQWRVGGCICVLRPISFNVEHSKLSKAGDNIVSSTDLYGGTWNFAKL